MADRVTATEVLAIMDYDTPEVTVEVCITAANALITSILGTDTTLSTTLLKEIERWAAAHMVASSVARTTKEEKIGDAAVVYTGTWGRQWYSTPYGQMVLTLDITGKLKRAGKLPASLTAITSFE